jgi:hypothetical protein
VAAQRPDGRDCGTGCAILGLGFGEIPVGTAICSPQLSGRPLTIAERLAIDGIS